jgi:ribosomal protein S27AE
MYAERWRELRTWTYASWGVLILLPIGAFLLSFFGFKASFNYFVPCWFVIYAYVNLVITFFRCPRCNKTFFLSKGHFLNRYTRKCMKCGLPKWAHDHR